MRDINDRRLSPGDAAVTWRTGLPGNGAWLVVVRVVALMQKRGVVVVELEDGEPLTRYPRDLVKVAAP